MPLKKLAYNVLAASHREAAIRRIRQMEMQLASPWARFAVPFVFRGSGHFKKIEPRQNPVEIERLYRMVCDQRPQRVLEIGTARGGSLYLWAQAAADDATIVSVDLPGGAFGGAYASCRIPFYASFARPDQHLHLVRDDSHAQRTVEQVRGLFADQPIDFAFIDGDHTYEGVKADFEQYGPLVRAGGLIAFHDILPRSDVPGIEVDRLWQEIEGRYETEALIGPDGSGRRIGIGVIRVPDGGLSPGCP